MSLFYILRGMKWREFLVNPVKKDVELRERVYFRGINTCLTNAWFKYAALAFVFGM